MALGRLWAGRVAGTHTGNLFAKLEGDDAALKGTMHFNAGDRGDTVVFRISGSFDGSSLRIAGTPDTVNPDSNLGALKATASLQPNGNLFGEWDIDNKAAGTFILFPHSLPPSIAVPEPDQFHSPRHDFRPIEIDREQLIGLADDIQRGFVKSRVVVTFTTRTEQSRYLEDFKRLKVSEIRAKVVKLFVREPDANGFDKSVTVEFGPFVNWAMVQSANESWALGELERLKREIRPLERVFSTQQFGVYITQFMLVCTIIFLPSLPGLIQRAILMFGVLGLMTSINWLNSRYLTHATIYLAKKKDGWAAKFLPGALIWLTGIAGNVAAALLGAYLQGWLSFP